MFENCVLIVWAVAIIALNVGAVRRIYAGEDEQVANRAVKMAKWAALTLALACICLATIMVAPRTQGWAEKVMGTIVVLPFQAVAVALVSTLGIFLYCKTSDTYKRLRESLANRQVDMIVEG